MNTLTQLTLGAVLGLNIAYSGCRGPRVPQQQIIYLDTTLRNESPEDAEDTFQGGSYTSLETTLKTTIPKVPDTSVPNKATIEATIVSHPDTSESVQDNYADTTAANLSQEVTSTTCPKRTNGWYDKIKSVQENKTLSFLSQQEQLGTILNEYVINQGGEIFIKVKYDSRIKNSEDICYRALSEVFDTMVGDKLTIVKGLTKLRFVYSLADYLCHNDTLTYDPNNPIVRFKAN